MTDAHMPYYRVTLAYRTLGVDQHERTLTGYAEDQWQDRRAALAEYSDWLKYTHNPPMGDNKYPLVVSCEAVEDEPPAPAH